MQELPPLSEEAMPSPAPIEEVSFSLSNYQLDFSRRPIAVIILYGILGFLYSEDSPNPAG